MKKIPTLFIRVFDEFHNKSILNQVTPGMEWVFNGEGIATIKIDGSCCAIINGQFYKRYDAKGGKKAPEGAIPCGEADPITGHWPHWVKVDSNFPSDKWHYDAYLNSGFTSLEDGTYEAIGPHFRDNPYGLDRDIIVKHGTHVVEIERSYEGIKKYLEKEKIEGLVFWKDGEPKCKIKRTDFGFNWPVEDAIY